MATATLRPPRPSFALLLQRYMRGEIIDADWAPLMQVLDANDMTRDERLALARFVNDLAREAGTTVFRAPNRDEALDLIHDTRC